MYDDVKKLLAEARTLEDQGLECAAGNLLIDFLDDNSNALNESFRKVAPEMLQILGPDTVTSDESFEKVNQVVESMHMFSRQNQYACAMFLNGVAHKIPTWNDWIDKVSELVPEDQPGAKAHILKFKIKKEV